MTTQSASPSTASVTITSESIGARQRFPPTLVRTRCADAPGAARVDRQHCAQLRPAGDLGGAAAERCPAALDHRRLPVGARRAPRLDGQPRRQDRSSPPAPDRVRRLRSSVRRRSLRAEWRVRSSPPVPCSASSAPCSCRRHCRCCVRCSPTGTSVDSPSRSGRRASRPAARWVPLVGGILLEHFAWGSVFLLAVPLLLPLVVLLPLLVPESRDPNPGRIDVPSILLSLLTMVPVVFGIKSLAEHGIDALGVGSMLVGCSRGCCSCAGRTASRTR